MQIKIPKTHELFRQLIWEFAYGKTYHIGKWRVVRQEGSSGFIYRIIDKNANILYSHHNIHEIVKEIKILKQEEGNDDNQF